MDKNKEIKHLIIIIGIITLLFFFVLGLNLEYNSNEVCKEWNNANKREIVKDDITKEQWVKCCFTQVREIGEIEQCKYIKVKK